MSAARPKPAFTLTTTDTRYVIYIEPPPAASPKAGPWPVLVCLDGDDQFAFLAQARADLVAAGHQLPPLLLVGVGYGASYQEDGNRRDRDYTPVPIEGAPEGGGADAFLDFIKTRLWPELATRYPLHPDIRGIAGHSLGALFALHALFAPAPFFNRVLASAPSIWWGERALLQRAANLRTGQAHQPARLFLGVGLKDSRSMLGDLDLLETQLDARPFTELVIHRERFPKKNHFNSIGPGFRSGLAALFGETEPA